jgi:ribonuclease T1
MRAALAALLVVCSTALAFSGSVRLEDLPRQARETLVLIEAGGPFPYARDGARFGNRERQLPMRERGYYREYTVTTPGVRGRGPRRIIAGRGGEYYYSDDHYRSFRRIIRP